MNLDHKKSYQPFGLWPSPISPAMLSQRILLNDVQWAEEGQTLIWLEGRSGQGILVARQPNSAARDLNLEPSIRGRVGYGGGEFTVQGNLVVFSGSDGRLYRCTTDGTPPSPILPPFGAAASPTLSPNGQWVVYVFSDGHTDLLGLVDSQGQNWPVQLARGADFYMQPTWSPDGKYLTWVEWNFPNMPWDGSRICLARMEGSSPRIVEQRVIAGGDQTPVSQPLFSPDGRWLSYITADENWESLCLLDLQNQQHHTLVKGEHFLLSEPAWVQGKRSYGWSHHAQHIYYIRNFSGSASLWQAALNTGKSTRIDQPYRWIDQLAVSPTSDQLAFIGSGPNLPARVVRWDGAQFIPEKFSIMENLPPECFPEAREISWPSSGNSSVYGLYYAPSNPDYYASGLPPAIVNIHGGPTSQAVAAFSMETAFFTSRGFAYLEVNYRGSSGYGRAYQQSLYENWGNYDVQDAISAAHALIDMELADHKRMVISGGSAGGYTVLNTLIHSTGLYRAGISRYGVSNLFTLDMDTHKFEKEYTRQLVGKLPEAANRYQEWSPVFSANEIQDPLAIFQGSEDTVVPPDQSEVIVAALKSHHVPHLYRLYPGEGHGFRKRETLLDYIQQVELFLKQHVIFVP